MANGTRITQIIAEPFDVEMVEPFGIAGGAQQVANNVLVTLELDDGSVGLGEAAPFPVVSGETQASSLAAIAELARIAIGSEAHQWRELAAWLRRALPNEAAARAAIETALLDALCRSERRSLVDFFGGADGVLETDVTIPTGSVEHARASAERAVRRGFRRLKIKIGGVDLGIDVERLKAVVDAAKHSELVLDANASMSADDAIELVRVVGDYGARIVLFEQPTGAFDLAGLRSVRERTGIAVAADESARGLKDVERLIAEHAADVVNVKIMKTGIAEALEIVRAARGSGLGLMIGGMVESVVAMTTSACLALGSGAFRYVDLDTPLFMRNSLLEGGLEYRGARVHVDRARHGHGVMRRADPAANAVRVHSSDESAQSRKRR